MHKPSRRFVAMLALGMALFFLLLNIALFNALPKPKRMTEIPEPAYTVADAQFERSLDALLHNPITAGNDIELLRDGEEIYPAMLAAIATAEHSITFETYEFWGEEAAGAITDALVAAAERGVKVKALIDFIGSRQASKSKFERMRNAGVEVYRYRSPTWYHAARFNHRTHRKFLIIDGQVGFIGGANISDNWLPDANGYAYRDNHFKVTGPVVAGMQSAFAESWLDATGVLLEGDTYFPELAANGEFRAQAVRSSPREGRHRMRFMLMYAIAAAAERITISTAYFYPDKDFLADLTAAAERGVEIRILVPGDSIDQGYLRHASVNRWGDMLRAGVKMYEYQPSMYHSKLITIDDRWSSVGSTNIDNRSFRINDEANINVYSDTFARDLRLMMEGDIADSEQYTLAMWENRPWRYRFYGWLGSLIGAYL